MGTPASASERETTRPAPRAATPRSARLAALLRGGPAAAAQPLRQLLEAVAPRRVEGRGPLPAGQPVDVRAVREQQLGRGALATVARAPEGAVDLGRRRLAVREGVLEGFHE